MKKTLRLVSILMIVCMLFSSCAQLITDGKDAGIGDTGVVTPGDGMDTGGSGAGIESVSQSGTQLPVAEKGTYNEGVVLVKCDGVIDDNVIYQLGILSATLLYSGSNWYTLQLKDGADTVETVEYLRELGCFDKVDYDYIMGVTAEVESVDISGNPDHGKQNDTFKTHHIKEGWDYLKKNNINPGGSSDVIVAVIDTGVDYNHVDLRNNIWVNPAEIPDNGKDDDGNGYVDDVYGWNCVGDNNNPMDDNGHGTHVAGIIAAENNKVGGIGVAYNCKVMVLKAGNSSGYFNNSDIAEAIQYAYMNGASVINMSFGGSNISIAVEEALENAYNSCVLVAAAGNQGVCNAINGTCPKHYDTSFPMYPAALSYVIGVMSTDKDGKHSSTFSNYDHNPYGSIEYEVYAVGEGVYSTWPNNRYATLSGTSMAAPTVAGIAALLRFYYSDREIYSTKFIQSQIVNTGTINPFLKDDFDNAHAVVDALETLKRIPKPSVNLYDYYIDDSASINEINNGNGVIDSGETIRLYFSLHNRGGVASDVNVSIDTYRGNIGDEFLTDPYITFVNSAMKISDIGTYSIRKSDDKYFEIIVDEKCPNDYLIDFNIRYTYKNGLDENDKTVYTDNGSQKAKFQIKRGWYLPLAIVEDTVYKADRLYLVSQDVRIAEGVTVTFEEGCQIQFEAASILLYGTLNLYGTKENMITLYGGTVSAGIKKQGSNAVSHVQYVRNEESLKIEATTVSDCIFTWGAVVAKSITDCYFLNGDCKAETVDKCFFSGNNTIYSTERFSNNIAAVNETKYTSNGVTVNNYFFKNTRVIYRAREFVLNGDVSSNTFPEWLINNAYNLIPGYYDQYAIPQYDLNGSYIDNSVFLPYPVNIEMFDKHGNAITTVGREEIKVRVTFNRAMDTTQDTYMSFGTIEPYADYCINGEWISDTVWEGSYTLKAQIENGQNFLKVNNACAADDPTKVVFGEYQLHEFTIDTTAAMSMNLIANPTANGIELNFVQDDYDTLLGYNIYRSTEKDGNYVKLNPAIILPDELTFLDENAEPGKTYWYTYTVVLTDFTESNPAGKVQATAMDTLAPNMYHTPVNQGYMNNNLVISCTASDNVAISTVTLYYRAVGASEWKTLNMAKQNDKYSATIFGSDLTLDGIEYYIVASDGRNTINKGSAETPYTVVVKDASAISRIGDVDGDGTVTTKDALMIMQTINEERILTDDEFKRADLNGDGVLNTSEALRILQYINGNVNTLEM